jgi:predicted GIY-YIG superfamily endonuclease
MKKFLIYEIIDNNNVPIYIGQTCNIKRRMQEHKKEIDIGKNHLHKKVRKLQREFNYQLTYNILITNLSKEQADEQEIYHIRHYKENGIKLCNLTDGGGGGLGHKPKFADEWRKKLSDSRKALYATGFRSNLIGTGISVVDMWVKNGMSKEDAELKWNELSKKQSKFMIENNPFKGKTHTDETKKKIAATAKKTFTGTTQSMEHIEKRRTTYKQTMNKRTKEQLEERKQINQQNRQKQLEKLRTHVQVLDINDNLLYELFGHGKEIVDQLYELLNIKFDFSSIKKVSNNIWSNHKNYKFKIKH